MQKYREAELKDGVVLSKHPFERQIYVKAIAFNKVGVEEYYIRIMSKNKEGRS